MIWWYDEHREMTGAHKVIKVLSWLFKKHIHAARTTRIGYTTSNIHVYLGQYIIELLFGLVEAVFVAPRSEDLGIAK